MSANNASESTIFNRFIKTRLNPEEPEATTANKERRIPFKKNPFGNRADKKVFQSNKETRSDSIQRAKVQAETEHTTESKQTTEVTYLASFTTTTKGKTLD